MAHENRARASTCLLLTTVLLALGACGDDDSPGAPDAGRDATTIDLGTRFDMAVAQPDAARDARAGDATLDDAAPGDATLDDAAGEDASFPDSDGHPRDAGIGECGIVECFRAYVCVPSCGEPPLYVGCCPCPEGTIDQVTDCRPDSGPPLPPGERCGGGLGECSDGYSCCYPCGIPGCDNICEPTCDESTPGCRGGCLLRP